MLLSLIKRKLLAEVFSATGFLGQQKIQPIQIFIYPTCMIKWPGGICFCHCVGKDKNSAAFEASVNYLHGPPGKPKPDQQPGRTERTGRYSWVQHCTECITWCKNLPGGHWWHHFGIIKYRQRKRSWHWENKGCISVLFWKKIQKIGRENNINDIFTSLYLITTLADERGQEVSINWNKI